MWGEERHQTAKGERLLKSIWDNLWRNKENSDIINGQQRLNSAFVFYKVQIIVYVYGMVLLCVCVGDFFFFFKLEALSSVVGCPAFPC